MKKCTICGTDISFFSGERKILEEKDTSICEKCYSTFGTAVNILKNSKNIEKVGNAYCQAQEQIKNKHCSGQEELLDDLQILYSRREKELTGEPTPDIEIEKASDNVLEEEKFEDPSVFSSASNGDLPYLVMQVTLKEKFWGTGSKNLADLENVINHHYQKGYRLHTMSTATSDASKGFGGGDRIQATLVFEKVGLFS